MAHRNQLIYLWFLLVIFHVFFVCFVYQRLWLQDWPPEAPGLWRVLPSFNPGRLPWPRKQPNGDRNEISAVAVFSKFTYFEIWLYKTCCRSYLRRIRWSLGLLSPELNTYLWVNTCNKVVSWDTSMCQDIRNQHKCEHRTKQHRYRLKKQPKERPTSTNHIYI